MKLLLPNGYTVLNIGHIYSTLNQYHNIILVHRDYNFMIRKNFQCVTGNIWDDLFK